MFGKKPPEHPAGGEQVLKCSFCDKPRGAVRKLIAGPQVFICDECVQVCVNIVRDTGAGGESDASGPPYEPQLPRPEDVTLPSVPCGLCGTPTPSADLLGIRDRGLLCPGCVGEIEAAAAESREPNP